MTCRIAVAGKGGVGKTLVSGLLVRHLAGSGAGPVLAVDADASNDLFRVLGLPAPVTVGAAREGMRAGGVPAGVSRPAFLEHEVEAALGESDGFDLLAMGRPEGPGCYCYANNLLRDIVGRIAARYRYVVVDNQAGMEHLSRRLLQDVDLLLVVSDPTLRGLQAAYGIGRVPAEVGMRVGRMGLLVNRVPPDGLPAAARAMVEQGPLDLLGCLPEDPEVARRDRELGDLKTLHPDSLLARGVADLARGLGLG